MNRFAPLPQCDLLFIAGEASGDEHAAAMVRKIRAAHPNIKIAALGGRHLHNAGAVMLEDLAQYSAVGLWEVLKKLPTFLKLLDETTRWISFNLPKRVVFVDYPGFNLEMAKRLFEKKISVKGGGPVELYFYVSPQIWAWKSHRRFNMARWLDSLGVIFPFEVEVYKDTSLSVEFVGHPFAESDFENPFSYDGSGPILLLPGSRKAIVRKHLPILWQAYRRYAARHLDSKVLGVYANEQMRQEMIALTDGQLPLVPSGAPLKASAVLCTAGTISLTVALAQIPAAILYKTDPLTYAFGRSVYKLPYLGMPNLLLKRPLIEEFIQENATPKNLAAQLEKLKDNSVSVMLARQGAQDLKEILSHPTKRNAAEWAAAGL